MSKYKLIPVVELPYTEGAQKEAGEYPDGSRYQLPAEWEEYFKRLHTASGYSEDLVSSPIAPCFYPIHLLTQPDIDRIVRLHLGVGPLVETCTLLGGYVLTENDLPILIPQCYSTLADISSWEAITRHEEFQEYFCFEGHPCPLAISDGDTIEIRCEDDESDSFVEPAPKLLKIERVVLRAAVDLAKLLLQDFGSKVNLWGTKRGHVNLEKQLIYEIS